MNDERTTRREFLKAGALGAGVLLIGCDSSGESTTLLDGLDALAEMGPDGDEPEGDGGRREVDVTLGRPWRQ